MKIRPVYTLYDIEVPYMDYKHYMHFFNKFPYLDVSDYEEHLLTVGINYANKDEQEKLLKKLTQEIEDYYKKD